MQTTPKGLRLHIAIFGRRNVGKSSVLNALTGQDAAIVSDVAGTTTDPVEKPMELLPLGPVVFIDTAGFDDVGSLGMLRTARTKKMLEKTDVALLVTEADTWGDYETTWLSELRHRGIPVLVVLNKIDVRELAAVAAVERCNVPYSSISARIGWGVMEAKDAIVKTVPDEWYKQAGILDGLVGRGDTVILVIPVDKEAPKGRIILPQVQTMRDILDKSARCLLASEKDLADAISSLNFRPVLVITDSQVFGMVAEVTPENIPMTSFSIAFARYKGDLKAFVDGAGAIDSLSTGDKVLVCEACTHHPIEDDIGRHKIPRWIRERAGENIEFVTVSGHDLPADLTPYSLVIHCGACMFNRKEMLHRILVCQEQGVPITNYGICIAMLHGIMNRAIAPFGL